MLKKYFEVPARKEVYEVTPGCCFVLVRYEDANADIVMRVDDSTNVLNSWDLECYCHPSIKITPISYEQYREKYEKVIKIMEQRAA